MTELLRISDLHLSLPDLNRKPLLGPAPRVHILKGVTFSVGKGEILGIVGGSGSGKSTIARCLVRLLEPTQGSIHFDGTDISHLTERELRPLRRRFQMIFQDPMSSLNPRQTVAQIIEGPLRLHGVSDPAERMRDALDAVGLGQRFAPRHPHEMSGGQRQRVGIARAIALRPDFIVADEVVSGLDVSSQAQVLALLERLVAELGLTVAFISHDLSVIRRLCDRVIVLEQGVIVEDAPSAKIFAAPSAAATKDLLASILLPEIGSRWQD